MKEILNHKSLFLNLFALSIFFFALFGFVPKSSLAANHYVRASASGGNNGSDWANAWNELNQINFSSVSCGDTVWVAGGDYTTALVPNKVCTGERSLAIRRARTDAAACTGAAGWDASYASTVHMIRKSIIFGYDSAYITISGRTTTSGGNNGWWIDWSYEGGGCPSPPASCGGNGVDWYNNKSNPHVTIEYMDLQGTGPYNITQGGTAVRNVTYSEGGGDSSYLTVSHVKAWDWGDFVYSTGSGSSHPVYEYNEVYDLFADTQPAYHMDLFFLGAGSNGTIRYNRFHKGPRGYCLGEGVFFGLAEGTDGWKIYGNIFYDLDCGGSKAISPYSGIQNLLIHNNTFSNVLNPILHGATHCGPGSESKNNIFYDDTEEKPTACGTTSNNLVLTSSDPPVFANPGEKDFHIVSNVGGRYPRNAGTHVSGYTTDMDGTTFGADGSWDIGAYEYAGPETTAPAAPRGLTVN